MRGRRLSGGASSAPGCCSPPIRPHPNAHGRRGRADRGGTNPPGPCSLTERRSPGSTRPMAPACTPRSRPLAIGASRWAAVSLTALVLGGCGGGASGFCNDYCDCVGCSDNEREDCIDDVEDSLDEADKAGCGGEADDVLS